MFDLETCRRRIDPCQPPLLRGRVEQVTGVMVEAVGVPAALGEVCRIQRGKAGTIEAEVVGFRGSTTLLMPHGDLQGIAPMQPVVALGRSFEVRVGEHLLGTVVDGFGRPMTQPEDNAAAGRIDPTLAPLGERRPVRREAPDPLIRTPIREVLRTGVRAVDGLNTIGRGQRVGIFAGSGVGKSTLLGQITRGTDADAVVCCLVGETRSRGEGVLGRSSGTRRTSPIGRGRGDVRPLSHRTLPGTLCRCHHRRVTARRGLGSPASDGLHHPLRDGRARDRTGGGRTAHGTRVSAQFLCRHSTAGRAHGTHGEGQHHRPDHGSLVGRRSERAGGGHLAWFARRPLSPSRGTWRTPGTGRRSTSTRACRG